MLVPLAPSLVVTGTQWGGTQEYQKTGYDMSGYQWILMDNVNTTVVLKIVFFGLMCNWIVFLNHTTTCTYIYILYSLFTYICSVLMHLFTLKL